MTEGQYNAATADSREVLCLACAGSGKSRTLAYRIAWLIACGADPNGIVAFTFTEKAAESIKLSVASALEDAGLQTSIIGAMYIGTIHSYCQHILHEMDSRYRQFDVLDENRLKLYLISRYGQLGLQHIRLERNRARYFQTVNEVANVWSITNDEMIGLDDISRDDPTL